MPHFERATPESTRGPCEGNSDPAPRTALVINATARDEKKARLAVGLMKFCFLICNCLRRVRVFSHPKPAALFGISEMATVGGCCARGATNRRGPGVFARPPITHYIHGLCKWRKAPETKVFARAICGSRSSRGTGFQLRVFSA